MPAHAERAPSLPVVFGALLFPIWTLAALLAHLSPWAPAAITLIYLVADVAIGLDRKELPLRLCLLFSFGLTCILVSIFVSATVSGVFYEDEAGYDLAARALVRGIPAARLQLDTGWPQLLAVLYRALGSSLVLARYLSATFGVLLVGSAVEVARDIESRPGSARRLYWLAGMSPALLVWVVGGIRDLGIGLGAMLVLAGLLRTERRFLRIALGAGLAAYLAPTVLWVLIAIAVASLALRAIASGRFDSLVAILIVTLLAIAKWGVAWGRRLNARYFAPATQSFLASTLHSPATVTGSLQASAPFALAAPILVVLQPVWFAMLSHPSRRSVLQAIGALGWWLLLPAIAIGFVKCLSDRRTQPLVLWAVGGLGLAAAGLLTVVQDPARLRVFALGAFFLLAWRAIDLEPSRVWIWTKRWVAIQAAVAGMYWLVQEGFPVVSKLGQRLGL